MCVHALVLVDEGLELLLFLSSDLPLLDVLLSGGKLQIIDLRADVGQLMENRHDHKLDETSLASSNVGDGSVAHDAHLEVLGFLHVTLVKELVEQQVGPLGTDIEVSK